MSWQQNQQNQNNGYGQQNQQWGQNQQWSQQNQQSGQQWQQQNQYQGQYNNGYQQQGGYPQQQYYGQQQQYSQNNPYANANQYDGYQQQGYGYQNQGYQNQQYGYQQNQQQNRDRGRGNNQEQRGRGQESQRRQQQQQPKIKKKDPTQSLPQTTNVAETKVQQPKAVAKPEISKPKKATPKPESKSDTKSEATDSTQPCWDDDNSEEEVAVAQPAAPVEEEEVVAAKPAPPAPKKQEKTKKEEPKKKKKKKKRPKIAAHDTREHMNLVFIGHVDAGKSTLSGRILIESGQIDDRVVQKFEREAKEKNRESWWIAYIMDTSEEERAKGKTVECGRAHFETDNKRYTILDAPGHKNYVPHMISGAAQADVAALVISARKNEFEAGFNRGGQTREHARLAFTLGIKRLLIVVNKMDTCDWGKERYDEICTKLQPFLKSVGYKWKDVVVVPVSGQVGVNISKRFSNDECPWYDGPCLLETLDSIKKIKRDKKKPLRIPVMDRYKDMGCVMAIGKVESNRIQVGDKVKIMPRGCVADVVKLIIDDSAVEVAYTGENVVVGMKGVSEDDCHGGFVLCDVDSPCPKASTIECQLQLLELLEHKPLFSIGYSAVFHCHNLSVECDCYLIPHKLQKKTMRKSAKPPAFLKSNEPGIVQLRLTQPSCVEVFEDFQQMGRFTIRDEGKTVAIGKITKIIN